MHLATTILVSILLVIIHLKVALSMLNNLSFTATKVKPIYLEQFRLTMTV